MVAFQVAILGPTSPARINEPTMELITELGRVEKTAIAIKDSRVVTEEAPTPTCRPHSMTSAPTIGTLLNSAKSEPFAHARPCTHGQYTDHDHQIVYGAQGCL